MSPILNQPVYDAVYLKQRFMLLRCHFALETRHLIKCSIDDSIYCSWFLCAISTCSMLFTPHQGMECRTRRPLGKLLPPPNAHAEKADDKLATKSLLRKISGSSNNNFPKNVSNSCMWLCKEHINFAEYPFSSPKFLFSPGCWPKCHPLKNGGIFAFSALAILMAGSHGESLSACNVCGFRNVDDVWSFVTVNWLCIHRVLRGKQKVKGIQQITWHYLIYIIYTHDIHN